VDFAHKSRWEIAEIVFGVPFLMSFALHFVIPFSISQGSLRQALMPTGIAFIIIGISFIFTARREFARYGQPTDPGQPTSNMVKTGVYSISRNPLYLGSVAIILGAALVLNIFWVLVTLLISVIICHYILIIPEEQYLAAKFGKEYEAYRISVRRWLGRK